MEKGHIHGQRAIAYGLKGHLACHINRQNAILMDKKAILTDKGQKGHIHGKKGHIHGQKGMWHLPIHVITDNSRLVKLN